VKQNYSCKQLNLKNMKAILKYAAIAAFAIIGTYGIYSSVGSQKSEVMSDVMKANVEALAKIDPPCPYACVDQADYCYCHIPTGYKEYHGEIK
jgi:hypothetical protein